MERSLTHARSKISHYVRNDIMVTIVLRQYAHPGTVVTEEIA